jgi:hypothetical protein
VDLYGNCHYSDAAHGRGSIMRQNSVVVVAFVISFSVLAAAIVGFGKKKD